MPANAEKNSIIKKISGFIKKEAVLSAAAILAVISMFLCSRTRLMPAISTIG